jgi:hypothetical protein
LYYPVNHLIFSVVLTKYEEKIGSMERRDEDLMIAHRQGGLAAFGELLRRYGDVLPGYLTQMCNNHQQAQDMFHIGRIFY